jgi:hypothetical protein
VTQYTQHSFDGLLESRTSKINITLLGLKSAKLANGSFLTDNVEDAPLRWLFWSNGSSPSNGSARPWPAGLGAGGRGGAGALFCFGGSCGGSEGDKTNEPVPKGSLDYKQHNIAHWCSESRKATKLT